MAGKCRYPFGLDVNLNAATAVDIVDPGATGYVYVTKVTLSITTHANAKFAGAQDSTPTVFANHIDATAAAGVPSVVTWDYGKRGKKLALGKKLQAISEVGGPSGQIYAEGYILK
jgi:hypothetical protein